MPFKSEAQRRYLARKLRKGEITPEEFEKWKAETPRGIPERLDNKPKKPKKPK